MEIQHSVFVIALIAGLISFTFSFNRSMQKGKRDRQNGLADLIRNAHLGKENKQEIFLAEGMTWDDLCRPMTAEQLAAIRSCDSVARHDVKVTIYKTESVMGFLSSSMFVTVDFEGFQGKTKRTVSLDHAKVRLTYARNKSKLYIQEIKEI